MRAVDVLSALDFVDSERIGVIGHSMGSAQAASTMARDPRVKAGLVTGRVTKKNLLPIAPRYLMTVLQSLDKTPEMIEQISGYFDEARREFYEPRVCPIICILPYRNAGTVSPMNTKAKHFPG